MIESVTSDLVSVMLDLTARNHRNIAKNVANSDTPNYRPVHVDFEAALSEVRPLVSELGGGSVDEQSILQALESLDPDQFDRQSSSDLSVESEMMEMVKNSLKYQALLGARNEFSSIKSIAIKGRA